MALIAGNSTAGVKFHLEQISTEFDRLVLKQKQHDEAITKLEDQLDIKGRAYKSVKDELEQKEEEWKKRERDLEAQITALKGYERRIVCLIDGDGTIFSRELLAQGQSGGQEAARQLAKYVHEYMSKNHSSSSSGLELSMFVFLHKQGLMKALGNQGYTSEKTQFDAFLTGFNQAGQRFIMVDVGQGKENADSKLRVFLQDHIRSPQTWKIFLGVCHDTGYVPVLSSLISDGFKEKIVLLPGYTEIESKIKELDFPTLLIPELFIPEKLHPYRSPFRRPTPLPNTDSNATSPTSSPRPKPVTLGNHSRSISDNMPNFVPSKSSKTTTIGLSDLPQRSPGSPASANGSVLEQMPQSSLLTMDTSPMPNGIAPLIPGVPLHKHVPPPCHHFYLRRCQYGDRCKFSHRYFLEPQNFLELRRNAKGVPCEAISKGGQCYLGDECLNGHVCPLGPNCRRLKEGNCFFKPSMHS